MSLRESTYLAAVNEVMDYMPDPGTDGADREARAIVDRVLACGYAPSAAHERLRGLISEYADHQSWRCGHPDRYPQTEDCPCGLLGDLAAAGVDPEPWRAVADGHA